MKDDIHDKYFLLSIGSFLLLPSGEKHGKWNVSLFIAAILWCKSFVCLPSAFLEII